MSFEQSKNAYTFIHVEVNLFFFFFVEKYLILSRLIIINA